MGKTALIIDGNSIINRAFFGIRNMATPDGFPTNALYGFLNIYHSIYEELKPDYVAVAFDLKGPTFRHDDYSDYKAGRKGMPDELAMQLPILKEILDAMGVKRMSLQGFEADDLLGTAAKYLTEQGVTTYLLTGDKDALQLVDDKVFVYYHGTKNKMIYTADAVREDIGVLPNRVVDLKGLMGDSSDNIPGIPKVGKVTANKLLKQFDSVEDLIARADQIENTRIRNLVEQYAEQAVLSKKLATIIKDVPVDLSLEDFTLESTDIAQLVALYQKYKLHSFLQRLSAQHGAQMGADEAQQISVLEIADEDLCIQFFGNFDFTRPIRIFTLYDKVNLVDDKLSYIGVADAAGKAAVFYGGGIKYCLSFLKSTALQSEIQLVGHDLKRELLIFKRYGIANIKPIFDLEIAMYLVDANRRSYALSDLALDFLGLSMPTEVELIGKGAKRIAVAEAEQAACLSYVAASLNAIAMLYEPIANRLNELNLMSLFDDIEMPLVEVLANMEYLGFNVNLAELDTLDEEITVLIEQIQTEIYDMAGHQFNINSPKQLGVVLFEELGLYVVKKTKTGYSTSHDVLLKLFDDHAIIPKVIDYRTYTKLKSTYVDGLRAVVNPKTGRIHSSLNQTVAATGRLSSTEPNLQNIPVKLELGRRFRKVFVASAGCTLVDADYSQIELRILADMSDDPTLKKAYTENIDIHALTAAQVFETPLDQVTPLLRSRAKAVNFGIIYGMSDYGLSENLHIDRKTAKNYIDNYFKKYPNVKSFMSGTIEQCKETGYAETLFGRKRFIPEIKNKNYNIRQYGERMAMNTPIQGTAADIIKLAMVKVYYALKDEELKSQLILQVHDELIIDTVPDELERVKKLLRKCMREAADLSVPLVVDMQTGDSWYDAK